MAFYPSTTAMPQQSLLQNMIIMDGDYSFTENYWPEENIDPQLRYNPLPGLQGQMPVIQRYLQEPARQFFSAAPYPPAAPQQMSPFFTTSYDTVPSQPSSKPRVNSPSPSQGVSESCSSAQSPEMELYPDFYTSMDVTPQMRQTLSDVCISGPIQSQEYTQQTFVNPCVNLSQVQGFSDALDPIFNHDDSCYLEEPGEDVSTIEVDVNGRSKQDYAASDSAIGSSIHDAPSPRSPGEDQARAEAGTQSEMDDDLDADAEGEDECIIVDGGYAEDSDDTDYTPKARSNKRKAPSALSSPTAKRGRPIGKKPNTKSAYDCKSCTKGFTNASALQHHVAGEHTRAFVCIFSFAGCPSTFASKNEWKRHVTSQHLNFIYWVCQQGNCGRTGHGSKSPGIFNRKDLFTQHMRRMHAPMPVKRQQKKDPVWEAQLRELQEKSQRTRRLPPTKLGCPVQGCTTVFESQSCWDDRMEHIGKHLEKVIAGVQGEEAKVIIQNEQDDLLVQWALQVNIIEQNGHGYVLCTKDRLDMDIDAEGEEC